MKNVPNRATGEAMSTAKQPDPRLALSFFRKATVSEIEAGFFGVIHWSVTPAGDYVADIKRGKEIAEEALAFMVAHPTNCHAQLIKDMLADAHKQADPRQRGILLGFTSRISHFALLGAAAFGADAVRLNEDRERAA